MPILETGRLVEQAKVVNALNSVIPSSTTPQRVSLKAYERCTIVINAVNGQTVTGSAITLQQANDIANANSDEKAVAFSDVYLNNAVGTNDTLVDTTVVSNTFTLASTSGANIMAIIEVDPMNMMDIANGFTCLRVGTGNATSQTLTVNYILWPAKYGQLGSSTISAETN